MKKFINILKLTVAYLGFLIGAGVATGQEILQFYTPYGFWMIATGLLIAIILVAANYCFSFASKNLPSDVDNCFVFYFGKKIGNLIDVFCTIFCFSTFIIMVSGGATSLNQEYSFPVFFGIFIIVIIVFFTIVFGLRRLVDILSLLTPIIIIVVLFVSIYNIFENYQNINSSLSLIDSSDINLITAGNNGFVSALANGGFCILMLSKFTSNLSKSNTSNDLNISIVVSSVILVSINIIVGFSLLSSLTEVFNVQIPNLFIFSKINDGFSQVFGILIFLALYTSACPLLWTVAIKCSKEHTKKFVITCALACVIGSIIAIVFEFNKIINIIYTFCGYVGILIFALMLISLIGYKFKK